MFTELGVGAGRELQKKSVCVGEAESCSYSSSVRRESWKAGPEAQGKLKAFKAERSPVKSTAANGDKVFGGERGQKVKLKHP